MTAANSGWAKLAASVKGMRVFDPGWAAIVAAIIGAIVTVVTSVELSTSSAKVTATSATTEQFDLELKEHATQITALKEELAELDAKLKETKARTTNVFAALPQAPKVEDLRTARITDVGLDWERFSETDFVSTGKPLVVQFRSGQIRTINDGGKAPDGINFQILAVSRQGKQSETLAQRSFKSHEVAADGANLSWFGVLPAGTYTITARWYQDRGDAPAIAKDGRITIAELAVAPPEDGLGP